MSWITLTEADALTVVNSPTLVAARTKALKAGQADPLTDTLQQVVDRVRGAVGASGRYILGEGATIPQKLKATALDLFAVRMLTRLDIDPEKAKVMLYDSAEAVLKDVRDGHFNIEEPLTPTTEVSSSHTPRITPRVPRDRIFE